MNLVDSRTGIEVLERAECLRLLAADEVGRIAVVDGGTPVIFPVNYAMDGEAVVIRSDPGTKLDAGMRARVCFEIDGLDRAQRTGWSVVVVGRLEEITAYRSTDLARLEHLSLRPWAGERSHWLRLVPSRITGRRISPAR
jgi:uncharacterized protein